MLTSYLCWIDGLSLSGINCEKYKIESRAGVVDIGIRYELPDKVMKKVNEYMYEGKFIGYPYPFKDKVRTFCQNPSGFVSTEVYDNNITLVNGHSYKERKSTNTKSFTMTNQEYSIILAIVFIVPILNIGVSTIPLEELPTTASTYCKADKYLCRPRDLNKIELL